MNLGEGKRHLVITDRKVLMQTLESREACHGQVMMVKITSPVRWLLKKQIQFDLEKLNK